MFRPIIPTGGLNGWQFLQSTYDRQLQSLSETASVRNETAYLKDKLSKPLTVEAFLNDPRLMRAALSAFDLGDEAWKRGFIRKVLTESSDPQSTFLARLNNSQYTRFAETFRPVNGVIRISPSVSAGLAQRYEAAALETAVGEIDNSMRLALNYRSEIGNFAKAGASNETIAYRILGNVPLRTVLERALNLPAEMRKLPVEKQADMLRERLDSRMRITNLTELASGGKITQVINRYMAVESIDPGTGASSPASRASILLSGIGKCRQPEFCSSAATADQVSRPSARRSPAKALSICSEFGCAANASSAA